MRYATVLLLLASAAVAWLFLHESGVPECEPGGAISSRAEEGVKTPRLVGRTASRCDTPVPALGFLEGVVTVDGRPAAARIALRPVEGPPLPVDPEMRGSWLLRHGFGDTPRERVVETRDGSFRVDRLRAGTWLMEARAASGATGWTTAAVDPECGGSVRLSLLGGGQGLEGRLRYRDGTPFVGLVLAYPGLPGVDAFDLPPATLPAPVPCDAEGRFALRGLPPGAIVLNAIVRERLRVVLGPLFVPAAAPCDLVVDGNLVRCHGVVVDAETGRPVPGARLETCESYRVGCGEARAATDADGRFSLWIEAGDGFHALASGYDTLWVGVEDVAADLVVRLCPRGGIQGRVVSAADGRPVAGAVVHAMYPTDDETLHTTSRKDGAYAFPAVASPWAWGIVLGGGWCSVEAPCAWVKGGDPLRIRVPGHGAVRRDLRVVPSARLEGRVLEEDGTPVVGVRVGLCTNGLVVKYLLLYARFVTDAAGRFVVPDVPPGVCWVLAVYEGVERIVEGPSILMEEGERATLDVRLSALRRMVLVVRDAETGAPVPDARADVGDGEAHPADADGRIVLSGFCEDSFSKVTVEARGFLGTRVDPWAAEASEIDVPLTRSAGLAGRVGGLPPGADPQEVEVRASNRRLAVGPDRTFEDPSFPPCPCKVSARLDHEGMTWRTTRFVRPGERDVHLVLSPMPPDAVDAKPRWVLAFVDERGDPVPRARVYAYGGTLGPSSDSGWHSGRTDEEGRIVVEMDGSTEAWVEVHDAEDAARSRLGFAPVLVGPLERDGGTRKVVLSTGHAIEGRVVDASGAPVTGARILALPGEAWEAGHRPPRYWLRKHADTRSGPDGRFLLGGLAASDYRLDVFGRSSSAPEAVREVRAGAKDVLVALGATSIAEVVVIDADGRPLDGAEVWWVVPNAGSGPHQSTDHRGRARLADLPTERAMVLRVEPPWNRPDLRSRSVEQWNCAPTTVRLGPSGLVTGRVLASDGTPVGVVGVWARTESGSGIRTTTDEEGLFGFPGVIDAGVKMRVHAGIGDRREDSSTAVDVVTPALDVVLYLPPCPCVTVRLAAIPVTEEPLRAYLVEEAGERNVGEVHVPDSGRIVFVGLRPDCSYTFYVPPPEGGVVMAWQSGLLPREEPYEVRMRAGAEVEVRVHAPAGIDVESVMVKLYTFPGDYWCERPDAEGRVLFAGVPPGRWSVWARTKESHPAYGGDATVEAPGLVTIGLGPR